MRFGYAVTMKNLVCGLTTCVFIFFINVSYAKPRGAGTPGGKAIRIENLQVTDGPVQTSALEKDSVSQSRHIARYAYPRTDNTPAFVRVKAVTAPNDNKIAWDKIVWNDGGPDPYHPNSNNYRLYPVNVAKVIDVQPKIGGRGPQVEIWVLDVVISNHVSGNVVDTAYGLENAALAFGGGSSQNNLGVYPKSPKGQTSYSGKMVSKAQILPDIRKDNPENRLPLYSFAPNGWDFNRAKHIKVYELSDKLQVYKPTWDSDDSPVKPFLRPDIHNRIFYRDAPDIFLQPFTIKGEPKNIKQIEIYRNFRVWVRRNRITHWPKNDPYLPNRGVYPKNAIWTFAGGIAKNLNRHISDSSPDRVRQTFPPRLYGSGPEIKGQWSGNKTNRGRNQ